MNGFAVNVYVFILAWIIGFITHVIVYWSENKNAE